MYLGAAIGTGLLILAMQLYRLQVVDSEHFETLSEANFVKKIREPASRGLIKDRGGNVLVDNRPSFTLMITAALCKDCRTQVLPKLASWLQWDPIQLDRVEALLKESPLKGSEFQPIPVQNHLTQEQFDTINAHKLYLPGVDVGVVPQRSYRSGTGLEHVLGYVGEIGRKDLERLNGEVARNNPDLDPEELERRGYALGSFLGKRGLERYYEGELRGRDGSRQELVNARGVSVGDKRLRELFGGLSVPYEPGNNLILSIDLRLQEEAERVFPGTAGAVVVVDVETGFLRAVVSRPVFDSNLMSGRITQAELLALSKDPLQPMVNRVSAQRYSPGSTFKVVTALAALRSGLFSPKTQVYCSGGYRLGARTWRCHKDSGHGWQDGRAALQHSCDTYYYKVADTLGLDPIAEVGRELGLGAPTGIKVLAEDSGIMPSTAYHDRVTPGGYAKGMALNSAIGQGDDTVTPLQVAMMYATIANGGKVFRPQLVLRTEKADGSPLETYQPSVLRTLPIPPEHRQVVVDALSAVVNEPGGTAYAQRLKDIKVAGKTGTAQVSRLGKIRVKTAQMDYFLRDHAWFASFAPVDKPEIAVVVLNEHGGHGGVDAAPTAMAVIKKYFELKKADAEMPASLASSSVTTEPVPPPSPSASALRPDGPPEPAISERPTVPLPEVAAPAAAAPPPGQPKVAEPEVPADSVERSQGGF